jgi:hypothetical protein
LDADGALRLGEVDAVGVSADEFSDGVFIALDVGTSGDDRRGGKAKSHLGNIGNVAKAVPARQDGELGVDHTGIDGAGSKRRQDIGHAADLDHGKIALALDRPLALREAQTEIGR